MNGAHPIRPAAPEQILSTRACALAAEEVRADDADHLVVLAFGLGKEIYGIELRYAGGVHPLKDVSYIPGAPDFILGIINMRGKILSVVDLKKTFGLAADASENRKLVILLENTEMEFGLAADSIIGVIRISMDEITASLPTLTGIRSDYLLGVSGDGTVILDGHKLLYAPEMRIDIGF
jgi:purine-binding chemotaxis protein CheW